MILNGVELFFPYLAPDEKASNGVTHRLYQIVIDFYHIRQCFTDDFRILNNYDFRFDRGKARRGKGDRLNDFSNNSFGTG